MFEKTTNVHAHGDSEASVCTATTQGLCEPVTEAKSIEALRAKFPGIIRDLGEENHLSILPAFPKSK